MAKVSTPKIVLQDIPSFTISSGSGIELNLEDAFQEKKPPTKCGPAPVSDMNMNLLSLYLDDDENVSVHVHCDGNYFTHQYISC